MCACALVLPQTKGPGPAQATPMSHRSANEAHRHGPSRLRRLRRPGKPPKAIDWVSGASEALPEAPGTHHEPNPKTYVPQGFD